MSDFDRISERKEEWEEEPSEGHFERFILRQQNQENKQRFVFWLKIAAVFVVFYLSANSYLSVQSEKKGNQVLDGKQKEFKEAGIYYENKVNAEMKEIEKLVMEGAGSEKDLLEVRNEFSQMDDQFHTLDKDYGQNPNDERLQSAIIQYYQSKIEIMNIVKINLENVKQQKIKYHENNKI